MCWTFPESGLLSEIERLPLAAAHVSGTVCRSQSVTRRCLNMFAIAKRLKSHLLGIGACDVEQALIK